MGHDHHFLSRLDRVAPAQVDFALSLYRDAELVRYVLARARVPERVERVAISMDDPNDGPFIIVARDGGFVTCLGRGMSPHPNPVLTRDHINALAAKFEDFRTRIAVEREWEADNGGPDRLVHRVFEAGCDLAREEFIALSALQPVLVNAFTTAYFDCVSDLNLARPALLRIERPRPRDHELLRSYFNQFHAVQHLALLTSMNGPTFLDGLPDDVAAKICSGFSWGLVRQGWSAPALRGAWAVARLGKIALTPFKHRYASSQSMLQTLDAGYGLVMLALRHSRMQAEVVKALSSERATTATGDDLDPRAPLMRKYLGEVAPLLAGSPEEFLRAFTDFGRALWFAVQQGLPEDHPMRFAKETDVPETLGRTLALYDNRDIANDLDAASGVPLNFPYIARLKAEDFYLPAEAVALFKSPWRPERTMELLEPIRKHYGKPQPVRVERAPGRNDPCPCNSGRKYKKCCGASRSPT